MPSKSNALHSGAGDAPRLISITYPRWQIYFRRHRIPLSGVTAMAAIDRHVVAGDAMVSPTGGTPPGCDLAALDPMRLRLSCDHY
jgi:hypothetical protein